MKLERNNVKLVDLSEPGRKIEYAGKVCYKSQNNITDTSYEKFITNIIKSGHCSVLEHERKLFCFDLSLFEASLKWLLGYNHYLNITFEDNNVFVSGDIRAWYDLVNEHYDNLYIQGIATKLAKDYPYIFKDYDVSLKCDYGIEAEEKCKDLSEHKEYTFEILGTRSFTHQIVRHRTLSFSQESQRYCVAGDQKLTFLNSHNSLTVKELYENRKNSINGSWKRINIEQLDENTGKLCFATPNEVFYMGKKPVLKIKTRLGYEIKCTKDHEIYTPKGYIKAENLDVNDMIYVNGKDINEEFLYRDYDWLYYQYTTLGKSPKQIADEFNFTESVIKKWIRKNGLEYHKRGTGTIGHIPWNKGLKEYNNEKVKKQGDALRKYHHTNLSNDDHGILKSTYKKANKGYCEICGSKKMLNVHHINEDHNNFDEENLMTLCTKCHSQIHNKNLKIIHPDIIISVENCGEEDVYDISMNSINHNFIANGIVAHNCNYSNDKFEHSIKFILPEIEDEKKFEEIKEHLINVENLYFYLIDSGEKPEDARQVLPNCTASTIVVTGTLSDWKKFLYLRMDDHAQKEIRDVANSIASFLRLSKEDVGL